jgi:alkylhydroperoxidase family enzyme
MTWVKRAEGAESLPNILGSHSLNADALDAHQRLYRTIMFGESPLTRSEREAIAVAVSAANDCHY